MCGIVGLVSLRSDAEREEIVGNMTRALRHRGPDTNLISSLGNATFGVARLAIIDLDDAGQPTKVPSDDVMTVCNGEIFNFLELRSELERDGIKFQSSSDVEVLPHLYKKKGLTFVNDLDGQFSIATFDCRQGDLILTRDPFGVTPLYYARVEDDLVFASEIRAIAHHPSFQRYIDPVGVLQSLVLPGLVSPHTLFAGVRSVCPGEHVFMRQHEPPRRRVYWDLRFSDPEHCIRSEEEALEELDAAIKTAVSHRLQSDVPIGVYLSGGLDSTLIAAYFRDQIGAEAPMTAISAVIAEREYSEFEHQRLAAEAVSASLHPVFIDAEDIVEFLPSVLRHCECPIRETFNVAAYLMSRRARELGCRVVLAGQGADELFGGYAGYRFDAAAWDISISEGEKRLREQIWGDPSFSFDHPLEMLFELARSLLNPDLFSTANEALAFNFPEEFKARRSSLRQRRSYVDLKLRLADHLLGDHGDRMVAAHGVEARYPFLSKQVLDVATRLPDDLIVKNLEDKYPLRRLGCARVPDRILGREKFGFAAPGVDYLLKRDRTGWIAHQLEHEAKKLSEYFRTDFIDALLKKYREPSFGVRPPLDLDPLMFVLSFSVLMSQMSEKD